MIHMELHLTCEGDIEEAVEYVCFKDMNNTGDDALPITVSVSAPSFVLLGEFARTLMERQKEPKKGTWVRLHVFLHVNEPEEQEPTDTDESAGSP